jgi:thymidylate synthase
MNQLDLDYQNILKDILKNGIEKDTRSGKVLSVFGRQIRHSMKDGFPLLTTKKMYFKGVVTELLWFLNGRTDLRWLLERNNTIWVGDAIKNYEKHNGEIEWGKFITKEEAFIHQILNDDEFSKKWGSLGKIYGHQWRNWGEWSTMTDVKIIIKEGIDQIKKVINQLKTNPDDRGIIVSAWDVSNLDKMVLRPCHNFFQFYTRELSEQDKWELYVETCNRLKTPSIKGSTNKETMDRYYQEYNIPNRAISLMFNMRSSDVPLGLPFNIASYGLLLEIIGKMVNMIPDELIGNLGDVHIYKNQIDGVKEQLTREPFELPKLVISNQVNFNEGIDEFLDNCLITDFQIENYESHPTIKIPLSN